MNDSGKEHIAILSTVINFELYAMTSGLFPAGIKSYVIDGRTGMYGIDSIYYMMKKLKGQGIKWLIMADEDVIFTNPTVLFDIISEMKSNDYTVCGVRDGGSIHHRRFNPFAINTFFSVLNFEKLESIWDEKEVRNEQYILDDEFADDFTILDGTFDRKSLYEPYYRFYFWLRRKQQKFLHLDSKDFSKEDPYANTLFFKGHAFLHHTWFSRAYGNNEKHTGRIDRIFQSVNIQNQKHADPVIFKDAAFSFKRKCKSILTAIGAKLKIKFG